MDHADLYLLRETYNTMHILLCFNGPFSQGLIEEIGNALRTYLESAPQDTSEASASSPPTALPSTLDVFGVYVELAQNIQRYAHARDYGDTDASATVVIGRDEEGRYEILAGNLIEPDDGQSLAERISELAVMDKAQLRAAYKQQLRKPRSETSGSAGLGLIDIARKASAPISCSMQPVAASSRLFFSLRVLI